MKKRKLQFVKPLLFSTAITTGIFIALDELHRFNNTSTFYLFSVVIFFIYFLELLISYQSKSPKLILNFNIKDEVNEFEEIFHKIVLPALLYVSVVLFGKFNHNSAFLPIFLIFVFIIFYILFSNISYFFKQKHAEETKTHYVYDIIKFLIFFALTNVLVNLFYKYPAYGGLWSFLQGILTVAIITIMVWRVKLLQFKTIILTWVTGIVLGGSVLVLGLTKVFSINESSLILLFIFYFAVAIIHHYLLKTLTVKTVMEYVSVILLLMAVTYGIR